MDVQRQLRDVGRLIDLPQETQSGIKENLQRQLQEVEQKRHDFLRGAPEAAEEVSKNTEYPGQEKHAIETAAAEDEMRKMREEIVPNEERFRLLSDKEDKEPNGRSRNGS